MRRSMDLSCQSRCIHFSYTSTLTPGQSYPGYHFHMDRCRFGLPVHIDTEKSIRSLQPLRGTAHTHAHTCPCKIAIQIGELHSKCLVPCGYFPIRKRFFHLASHQISSISTFLPFTCMHRFIHIEYALLPRPIKKTIASHCNTTFLVLNFPSSIGSFPSTSHHSDGPAMRQTSVR